MNTMMIKYLKWKLFFQMGVDILATVIFLICVIGILVAYYKYKQEQKRGNK